MRASGLRVCDGDPQPRGPLNRLRDGRRRIIHDYARSENCACRQGAGAVNPQCQC